MKKSVVLLHLFLLFLANNSIFAQSTFGIDLQKSSTITIHGTTNLISFKLTQKGDKLSKRNFLITATQNQNKILLSQNEHTILVKDFTSDNKMALRDFMKLVKATTYPSFSVKLESFEIDPKGNNKDLSKAIVSVDLTITGKTKHYNISVNSIHDGDIYKLNGIKKINIRDFGLEPPVEMLGLIRVNEWINIDFDIICKITIDKASQELNASTNPLSGTGKLTEYPF